VDVRVGSHHWALTDDDPPVYGLADPLTIGWENPESEQRPAQPDPMVAEVNLVLASAADLADMVQGDLVTIAVTFGANPKPAPDVFFVGRVAQANAMPLAGVGMLYKLTCSDLSVDLAGYDIGADIYPYQRALTRQSAMIAAAGLAPTDLVLDPVISATGTGPVALDLLDPAAADLLSSTIELWDQVAFVGLAELATTVFYRAIVAPYPGVGSLGPTVPYRWGLDAVPDAYIPTATAPLPATFGHYFTDPAGWGLWLDPDDRAAGVIDACRVEYDAEWAAITPNVVNRAAVTWATAADALPDTDRVPQVTYSNENPPPIGQSPVTATRETTTLGVGATDTDAAQVNANRLGRLMIPAPQNPAGWAPDAFRWLLYADPAGLETFPVLFPHHDASGAPTPRALRTAAYVRPVVVTPIPLDINAADATRDWVAGQLTSVQLTIEDGRPVVDFTLTPTIPPPANPDTSRNAWNAQTGTWDAQVGVWDDLEAARAAFRWDDQVLATGEPGGVLWDQIYPGQSWDMYRLARGN
jgi:hypothetical protein